MELIRSLVAWCMDPNNLNNIGLVITFGFLLAESIVRITPTDKDDGAVKRAGEFVDRLLSKLPNNVRRKKVTSVDQLELKEQPKSE